MSFVYTLQLPHDPRAPGIARCTMRAVLLAHGLEKLSDTATLLTSELVTNAYEHTKGPSSLRLRRFTDRFRVSVWDSDSTVPPLFLATLDLCDHPVDMDLCADRGRGLILIRQCADNWGGHTIGYGALGPAGKLLWFELAA